MLMWGLLRSPRLMCLLPVRRTPSFFTEAAHSAALVRLRCLLHRKVLSEIGLRRITCTSIKGSFSACAVETDVSRSSISCLIPRLPPTWFCVICKCAQNVHWYFKFFKSSPCCIFWDSSRSISLKIISHSFDFGKALRLGCMKRQRVEFFKNDRNGFLNMTAHEFWIRTKCPLGKRMPSVDRILKRTTSEGRSGRILKNGSPHESWF